MRLNNFVEQIFEAHPDRSTADEFECEIPRTGWVLLRSEAGLSASGSASVELHSAGEVAGLNLHDPKQLRIDSMHYLHAGAVKIRAKANGTARVTTIILRTVPEIIYANYPANPHLKEYGPYDWDFLTRVGMLSCANVIVTSREGDWTREWLNAGRRILHQVSVPGLSEQERISVDSLLEHWGNAEGWISDNSSGVIADEFLTGREQRVPKWSEAVVRLTEDSDRVFYAYLGGDGKGLGPIVHALGESRCRFAYERYLREQPSEKEAREHIRDRLTRDVSILLEKKPDLVGRLVIVLGLLCGPPETLNTNPQADYKVYMDMQFNHLANEPVFEGLYGIEEYLSSYADEEYLRWAARLYRHYCIEGRRDRLASDPYELRHIQNPDFGEGLRGWELHPAEDGSISTRRLEGFGWLEGRYPRGNEGDSFLWMRRSARGPNLVEQRIANLTPGRTYSVKMYLGDLLDPTRKQVISLSLKIGESADVPQAGLQGVFQNCYSHHIDRFGETPVYFNFLRKVFRPATASATLSISDWVGPGEPGGPPGQEVILNFVEVEPFLPIEES